MLMARSQASLAHGVLLLWAVIPGTGECASLDAVVRVYRAG